MIRCKEEKNCDHLYKIGNKLCIFCGKEKVIRFFELDGYYDKESFLLGQKANFNQKNPFKPSTNSWFNWNNGKNTNNN